MNQRQDTHTETATDTDTNAMASQRGSALSTADMAAAANRSRDQMQDTSPKYVEGEENSVNGATRTSDMARSASTTAASQTPLFPNDETEGFRGRWTDVQAGFVDEPRNAVQQADGLVAEVMQRLAQIFADERSKMEHEWDRGDDVSTEDLRMALQRYRSFFERLLSA